MNRKSILGLLILAVVIGFAPSAETQGGTEDVTALRKEMEKQYEALAKMQALPSVLAPIVALRKEELS